MQQDDNKPRGIWVLFKYFFKNDQDDNDSVNPTVIGQSKYKTGLHLKAQDYVDSRGLSDIEEIRDPKSGDVFIGGQGGEGMFVLWLRFKKFLGL